MQWGAAKIQELKKVIEEELPKLKKCFNKKVMANVSGFSIDDYVYTK